ncbi:hypothetical protein G6047_15990 [Flavobacterium sp. SE-s28]|uniref:HmuY protein n=2 Tax=Flavobacterium silvaticum TaxID=1852020 RepID=A0A972G2Y3_9FLAO|nr:hypothetical protein [Flavobacterium silvaticum]
MFVVFSETATANGTVTIGITSEEASYGVDFKTTPEAPSLTFTLPIIAGQDKTSFLFQNLIFPFDSDQKVVTFQILSIDYARETNIQGYTTSVVSFEESLGGVSEPHIGGPNQGNQIYVDLSSETTTEVFRESWDLGFYCGDDFRVGLNGSLYMAAKKLDATNIDAVTQASVSQYFNQVAIGTFDPANMDYVDDPTGAISGTAIDAISVNDADNHVYLVNLGYTVGTTTPVPGSVAIAGNPRGWKKIRVLRQGDQYILQYANLNSTSHQEVVIEKDAAYNFRFFSFNTNNTVSVEPMKDQWDLNFTVFTNEIAGSGSYGYSDFVLNNLKGGAKAYEVSTSFSSYADFSVANIDESLFQNDQRVIGADWRDVFSGTVYTNRFYVLKDPNGIYYKIRMLGFLNTDGVRGYPKFEYALLQ